MPILDGKRSRIRKRLSSSHSPEAEPPPTVKVHEALRSSSCTVVTYAPSLQGCDSRYRTAIEEQPMSWQSLSLHPVTNSIAETTSWQIDFESVFRPRARLLSHLRTPSGSASFISSSPECRSRYYRLRLVRARRNLWLRQSHNPFQSSSVATSGSWSLRSTTVLLHSTDSGRIRRGRLYSRY
jgi:hypothetical protein